jgi:hypothetical protein
MSIIKYVLWVAIVGFGVYVMNTPKLNFSFTLSLGVLVILMGILGLIRHLISHDQGF